MCSSGEKLRAGLAPPGQMKWPVPGQTLAAACMIGIQIAIRYFSLIYIRNCDVASPPCLRKGSTLTASSHLPLRLFPGQELLEYADNLLQRREPLSQLRSDGALIITELLVEVLPVRSR